MDGNEGNVAQRSTNWHPLQQTIKKSTRAFINKSLDKIEQICEEIFATSKHKETFIIVNKLQDALHESFEILGSPQKIIVITDETDFWELDSDQFEQVYEEITGLSLPRPFDKTEAVKRIEKALKWTKKKEKR